MASILGNDDGSSQMEDFEGHSRTELDSHANMVVIGKNTMVLNTTGRSAIVRAFSPEHAPIEVAIVDAAIVYDCPYGGQTHIIICLNALHVPSMEHNLVPPFIMREAGITVNDVPKIHTKDPGTEDHSIYFAKEDVRIPLLLCGTFSYFPTRKPTTKDLVDYEEFLLALTPEGHWNPNTDVFSRNEEAMLDWEGNVIPLKDRPQIMMEEIEVDDRTVASYSISAVEVSMCDAIAETSAPLGTCDSVQEIPLEIDELSGLLYNINPILVQSSLSALLAERRTVGAFCASIGSTMGWENDILFPEYQCQASDDSDIDDIELDALMVCSTQAVSTVGVSPEHLSKVWRIDLNTAKRTIDVTTQLYVRTEGATTSRNYSTNDRMLRYKRIHQHFFTDTFFATSKARKSSRGNTCMQLFVTDKGYVYVVPMQSRSEVAKAIKLFMKDIGAPDALICDAAREQISQEVRSFCHKVGTTLRVLEEDTPWSNRAELYIGFIKEGTRKDMKESDSPLVFWDYCAERRARINNLTAKSLFQLEGQTPHFSVTGEHGDISNLCQYAWYEWVYFRDGSSNFPFPCKVL